MPATHTAPNPLEVECHVVGIVKCQRHHDAGCLIGQIKLTRIHVAFLFLPRGAGSNATEGHLFTMSKDPPVFPSQGKSANFVSLLSHACTIRESVITELNQIKKKKWWSLTGSNRRHPACKAGALPAELRPHSLTEPDNGWPGQTRTADLTLIRRAL